MKLWSVSKKKKSTWKTQSFEVAFSLTHLKLMRHLPVSLRFVWAVNFSARAGASTSSCKALADARLAQKNGLVQRAGSCSRSLNGAAAFIKAVRRRMGVLCSTPVLPSGHSKLSSTSNRGLASLHLVGWISAALQARNKIALHKKERRKEEAASLPSSIYMRKPEI